MDISIPLPLKSLKKAPEAIKSNFRANLNIALAFKIYLNLFILFLLYAVVISNVSKDDGTLLVAPIYKQLNFTDELNDKSQILTIYMLYID